MSEYALADLLQGQKVQVEIDGVAGVLRELEQQAEPPIALTSELNLVILLSDVHRAEQVLEAVAEFSQRHSNRALIIIADAEAEEKEETAFLSMQCLPGSQTVCCQQVTLRICGAEAVQELSSKIWSLLVAMQPILFWSVQGLPESSGIIERLQKTSAKLAFDSALAPELGITLARANELAEDWKAGAIEDLNWLRLAPWREVVQSHLNTPSFQEFTPFIDEIMIEMGGAVLDENRMAQPALLFSWLAGVYDWQLSESLAYENDRLHAVWNRNGNDIKCAIQIVEDAEPELCSVEIHARQAEREIALKVIKSPGQDETLLKCALTKGTPGGQGTLSETQKSYSPSSMAQLLAQIYERKERDEVFLKTLRLATKMV